MIDTLVGKRLKRLREELHYSLEDVSRLTGVSKPSLSNIERGTTSTSIKNLWKISKGLSLPISYFFTEDSNSYELVTLNEQQKINSENDSVDIFNTFTWQTNDSFETFFLNLKPGAKHSSNAHATGVTEIIITTKGILSMSINNNLIQINEGQLLRFNANVQHDYLNQSTKDCSFFSIMSYPHKGEI